MITRGQFSVFHRNLLILKNTLSSSLLLLYVEPFLFYLVLGYGIGSLIESVDGVSFFKFITPGFILATQMQAAFNETALGFHKKIEDNCFLSSLNLTPISKSEIIMGEILWGAFKGVLATFLLLAFGLVIGTIDVFSLWMYFIAIISCSFIFSSLGMMACSFSLKKDTLLFFYSFVLLPMYFLSGTFFPIEILPDALYIIALVLPLTHAILTLKVLLYQKVDSNFYIHLAVLFIYGYLFFYLSMSRLHKLLHKRAIK